LHKYRAKGGKRVDGAGGVLENPRRKPETETETESVTESAEVATAMQNIYRLPPLRNYLCTVFNE